MSSLEQNEGNRIKARNVLDYAAGKINGLDIKDTMAGTKTISAVYREANEGIRMYKEERNKKNDRNAEKTPIVTGAQIENDYFEGEYRPLVDIKEDGREH